MEFIWQKFPSLRHKNFRILWFLEIFSLLGVWVQATAQSWLVYKITNSPMYLSIVSAMQFMPVLIFSVFAGVMVDRFPKRKVLLITQYSLAVLAFLLSLLVLGGAIRYWHIVVFATLLGVVNTFDMPTRHSIIMEFVGSDDLTNAVALNSGIFNIARMVGPAIAGILMRDIGIGYCFLVTAVLYIPIITFLTKVKTNSTNVSSIKIKGVLQDVGDGIKYILSKRELYVVIFLVVVMGIFALNYSVFLPVLAKDVLKMDAKGYGNLMSSVGIGAFLGALVMSQVGRRGPKVLVMLSSLSTIVLVIAVLGYAKSFWPIAVLLVLTGFCNNVFFTNANSMLMLNAKDEFRGRVMSVYTLAFSGTSPIGNLFSGIMIERYSVKMALVLCGIIIAILVGTFLTIEWYIYRRTKVITNVI